MPLQAHLGRAHRQSLATPAITLIVDFVFERDVLRDENLITDARLKLFERALELLTVEVGREQGAQGARPEPVVNRELPFFRDDIEVEIIAQTGSMLSKFGFEFGFGFGFGLGLGSGFKARIKVGVSALEIATRADYPDVVPSFLQHGLLHVAPGNPRVPGLVDHRIQRTRVADHVPPVVREPPLHEVAHPRRASERGEHQAVLRMAKEDLVISLERDTFHDVVQRAVFDVRAGAVEANHLPPLGLEREVRALEGRLRRGRGGRRGRWRLGRRR